jgi:predicted RNA-binding Zn ribbon-like protein
VHSHQAAPEHEFDLSGGALCLDFANTVSWRQLNQRASDHLRSYDDLIAFAEQSQVLTPEWAADLRAHARQHGREAQQALRRALTYREIIYRTFAGLAQRRAVLPRDLKQINHFAIEALAHRRLTQVGHVYRWQWECDDKRMLELILWLVAQSATELLTSSQLSTVRICGAPTCAWLFLDHSRNRSRRWCDMKVCGNRQKARRHYQRTHG